MTTKALKDFIEEMFDEVQGDYWAPGTNVAVSEMIRADRKAIIDACIKVCTNKAEALELDVQEYQKRNSDASIFYSCPGIVADLTSWKTMINTMRGCAASLEKLRDDLDSQINKEIEEIKNERWSL